MVVFFYNSMLALSLVLTLVYLFLWHKHFDVHITLVFALVPVTNLGYTLMANASDLNSALVARKLTYIGGCYLLLMILLIVFSMCHVKIHGVIRVLFMSLSTFVYISALTIGSSDIFYKKEMSFEIVDGAAQIQRTYGPMHTVFSLMMILYFTIGIAVIIYSLAKKNQVSRVMLYLLVFTEVVAIAAYVAGRIIKTVEPVPAAFVIGQLTYIVIIKRISLYDVTDVAIDSMVQSGDTGFISIDFKYRYLGSNNTARKVFPALENLTVDKTIIHNEEMQKTVHRWLETFKSDNTLSKFHYEVDNKIYLINISYLYDGSKNRGYQLFITDDTKNQQYIKLIDTFNDELIHEVQQKTAKIVEMHDKMVLGMATLVESRDNTTGGHIKRTSDGIKLLTDEMKKENFMGLSDQFYRNLIKAAPMHDLGKIAVDDAILRKPGRLTDDEYKVMKSHAAIGAMIVHQILDGTEDEEFRKIAENVAHYHHERWDGKGYPDQLAGDDIPIEARIMAVADVYDVLVSKRSYKEKMSFEDADRIILEGMGSQFDKSMEPFYIKARPKLEAYYSSLEAI